MKENKELAELASKVLKTMHGRYQEMCSLAATGQLGGPQMSELNGHIAACDSCRKFLESVAQVSMQVMPVLAEDRVSAADIAPPQGMRARFLSRIAAEELSNRDGVSPAPILVKKPLSDSLRISPERNACTENPGSSVLWRSVLRVWRPAAILAACVVFGIAGFFAGHQTSPQASKRVAQLHSPSVPSPRKNPADDSDRVSSHEQQRIELETRLRETDEKLNASEARVMLLNEKLKNASNRLSALTTATEDEVQRLTQEGQQGKSQVTYLQSEVEKLRWQLDDAKTKLAAQQNESEQLRAKLELTESDFQRELELKSAKSDMGDLIAARNLHIVDVYDADPDGKRQRSFGRVFYIEGKSLVFYAYDLEGPGRFKANVVFHVWGGKAGVKEVTHSLGVLRKEDAGQGRWAMTFDDPRVLAQINSVFVTAESANKHYDEPHGKKVLYAYFGSQPNHP